MALKKVIDAAALDFFGPEALNVGQKSQIQTVMANAATIRQHSCLTLWCIHVRCDNPKNLCTKDDDDDPWATAISDHNSIDEDADGNAVVLA